MKNTSPSSIYKYFDDIIEYPKNVIDNPIPYGVCWQYISDALLNGFINYSTPIVCFIIDLYKDRDELLDDEPGTVVRTKQQYIDYIKSRPDTTSNLGLFGDDIVIISKVGRGLAEPNDFTENSYIFFWFSRGGDSNIGKFKTTDAEETIISALRNGLDGLVEANHMGCINGYTELPIARLSPHLFF